MNAEIAAVEDSRARVRRARRAAHARLPAVRRADRRGAAARDQVRLRRAARRGRTRRCTSTTRPGARRRRATTSRSRCRTRCGRAAPSSSTTAPARCWPPARATPTARRSATRPSRACAWTPGVSVHYGLERGRFLVPAALVAWVIALELTLPWLLADLGVLAASASPAIAVLLSSTAVFSALGAAQRRAPAGAARARALPAVPGRGDRRRGGRRRGRWPSGPRARRLDVAWGVGAVVAVLAAGILTGEAAHAPAAAKEP